ncbi:MAG: ABC transporter permease [Chloroflexaceae bacterium]|nr:ABC transporter permease [Chloroflexaceae bacterium]
MRPHARSQRPPGPRQLPLPLVSTTLFLFIVLSTLVGPLVVAHPPGTIDFSQATRPPGWEHPFGTNDLGQDMLARVLVGGRVSIGVGLGAMVISTVLGTAVGVVAGFAGGLPDALLMRLADAFLALPHLPLLLLTMMLFRDPATSLFGPEYGPFALVTLVIGGLSWMTVARLVRATALTVREMEFVVAARALGASPIRLIRVHVLPHVLSPVIVAATLSVSSAIVMESTLSFLGLGFPPDTPTWGRLLYHARDFLDIAPHMALFPGLALFLTVLSLTSMGDRLQATLEPRRVPNHRPTKVVEHS